MLLICLASSLILIGWGFFFSNLLQTSLPFALFNVIAFASLIMFYGFLLVIPQWVAAIFLILGSFFFFYFAIKNKLVLYNANKDHLHCIIYFILLAVIASYLSANIKFRSIDDYSFWGTISKYLFLFDRLPSNADYIHANYLSYIPGMASFHYLIYFLAKNYSQQLGYFAQNLVIIGSLMPFFDPRNSLRSFVYLSIWVILFTLSYGAFFVRMEVDAYAAAYLLALVWLVYKKESTLLLVLPIVFLSIIKEIALLSCFLVIVLCYLRWLRTRLPAPQSLALIPMTTIKQICNGSLLQFNNHLNQIGVNELCSNLNQVGVNGLASNLNQARLKRTQSLSRLKKIGQAVPFHCIVMLVLIFTTKFAWKWHTSHFAFISFAQKITLKTAFSALNPFSLDYHSVQILYLKSLFLAHFDYLINIPYLLVYLLLGSQWFYLIKKNPEKRSDINRCMRVFLVFIILYLLMVYWLEAVVFGVGQETNVILGFHRYYNILFLPWVALVCFITLDARLVFSKSFSSPLAYGMIFIALACIVAGKIQRGRTFYNPHHLYQVCALINKNKAYLPKGKGTICLANPPQPLHQVTMPLQYFFMPYVVRPTFNLSQDELARCDLTVEWLSNKAHISHRK